MSKLVTISHKQQVAKLTVFRVSANRNYIASNLIVERDIGKKRTEMLFRISRTALSYRNQLTHSSFSSRNGAFSIVIKRDMHLLLNKTLINGNWVSGSNNEELAVHDPATGRVVGHVPDLSVDDAEEAIKAAHQAFYSPGWSTLTAKDRSGLLKVICL